MSKNVPIKGLNNKRQITATFVVSATGFSLLIQLIYQGKSKSGLPNGVCKQLLKGVAPGHIKISCKLSDLKPLHAWWIVETFNHLKHQNDSIIKDFDAAGISDVITCANDVFTRVENPFDEQRQQQHF